MLAIDNGVLCGLQAPSPVSQALYMPPETSLQQLLQDAAQRLQPVSDSARLDAEILLSLVLGRNRSYLHTWPERTLSDEQQQRFLALVERRARGEPIAYITGRRGFWDMELKVTPDTLIPRPETERLVELALERIPQDAHWQILDLGTGSGAIALAIARQRPHCQLLATDLTAEALAVAEENARTLGVGNIRFLHSHWFDNLGTDRFEMIVSNPPYIHPQDPHLEQGDVRFEPISALRSASDGLADIQAIARGARDYLAAPGWLLLEHGYDQGPAVAQLLMGLGYHEVCVYKDLGTNDRICAGRWDQT